MREHNRQHRDCDHRYNMDMEHDGSLADLLDRCGHYYTHRIGNSRRGQDSVMTWLANNPDATQKEISEGLGITAASLSEVLMKLERKGYITRFKDEADRRFSRVRLTEEGEDALDMATPESDDPFTALSEEEQETLKQLLGKLLADWEVRYIYERKRQGSRQFEQHGNEHPGHGDEHPGHGDEHPGHRREERGTRSGRKHGRDAGRRGHGNRDQ